VSWRYLGEEVEPDGPLAGFQHSLVLLAGEVDVLGGFLDLLLDIAGQGARSFLLFDAISIQWIQFID
jgi:hypothetical protein